MKMDLNKQFAIKQLQHKLRYTFVNQAWLIQALTHRSFSAQHYERLEFVGDGILNYVVAKMLYEQFAQLPEGKLSRLRANLVNQTVLAEIARDLNIGAVLFLGQGELKSGGHDRSSILADVVEAILAAIGFDSDFAQAERTVKMLFQQRIQSIDLNESSKDAKSALQEWLQARRLALPKYRIEQQMGMGNQTQFDVSCDLGELGHITYAHASSRREAEQLAAQEALKWLKQECAQK